MVKCSSGSQAQAGSLAEPRHQTGRLPWGRPGEPCGWDRAEQPKGTLSAHEWNNLGCVWHVTALVSDWRGPLHLSSLHSGQ